jgi:hypothetical protein
MRSVKHVHRFMFRTDEDEVLRTLVDRLGSNSWAEIASNMAGRNARQCRDRWNHYLHQWVSLPRTVREDGILVRQIRDLGFRWAQIANFLPLRTVLDVKTRWNELIEAQQRGERSLPAPLPEAPPQNQTHSTEQRTKFPSLAVDPLCPFRIPTHVFQPMEPARDWSSQ